MKLALHFKQTLALNSIATEILYGGAAGGGKSHLMRVAAIVWCLLIPGLQVYIFRRTYPDLWKNHMEGPKGFPAILAEWILMGKARINYGDKFIEFDNGSKIFLCHCQHEKDVYSYQGAEIHVLMMDELTQFTETIYRFLRGRVRMIGLTLTQDLQARFPRILCSSNPGGVGHNWVKNMFVDMSKPMSMRQMKPKEGGMIRQYIPARIIDNPSLTNDDPNYEDRLEGLSNPALVRAMKLGDWDIVAGGMFDDVWDRNIHVLPQFKVFPEGWVDRTFDWGSSRPFSVGWWVEVKNLPIHFVDNTVRTFPRGTLIRFNEWYGWNGTPNEGCKMISKDIAEGILTKERSMMEQWSWKHPPHPGAADSSIYDVIDNRSIAKEMADVGVDWRSANKSPGSRVRGWELYRSRLKACMAERMEEPGLLVTDNCLNFIRTIPTLPRDKRDTDDVDTDAEDHIGDESRYRVLDERHEINQSNLIGA